MGRLKRCHVCGQSKSLDAFHRCARNKDGRQSRCKECDAEHTREWRAANREKARAQSQRANEKDGTERQRRYREKHRDVVNARKRAVRAADPEKARAESRANHAKRREAESERHKQWLRENPERKRAYKHKRRQQQAVTDPAVVDYAEVLRGDPCAYCGGPAEHIDHIVPLAQGGLHSWDNITSACSRCNQSKHTRSLLEHLLV